MFRYCSLYRSYLVTNKITWLIKAILEKKIVLFPQHNILFPQERYFAPTTYYLVPITHYIIPPRYYFVPTRKILCSYKKDILFPTTYTGTSTHKYGWVKQVLWEFMSTPIQAPHHRQETNPKQKEIRKQKVSSIYICVCVCVFVWDREREREKVCCLWCQT